MKLIPLIAACCTVVSSTSAFAVTLAQWTFETSIPTTAGGHAAESGISASTSLASTNSGGAITNPAGNGSAESFSSDGWATTEYFQFTTKTTGYEGITLTFDQTGSSSGPRDFVVSYSTNGTTFTATTSTYAVLENATGSGGSWSATLARTAYTYSFDYAALAILNNQSEITFRLSVTSATSTSGGAVGTGGTSRVDNVVIAGTAVPEPASVLLGAIGALGLLRRRR